MALSATKAHILWNHPMKAVLYRTREYRKNGITHIEGNGGKRSSVYDNDDKISKHLKANDIGTRVEGATAGDALHAAGYHFKHFAADNAGKPYPNEGHHILPCELFSRRSEEGGKQGGVFGTEEFRVLYRLEYDINNGNNIIFLPALTTDCGIHQLPYHVGSHPAYTTKVSKDVEQINALLKKSLEEPCEGWTPPENIPKELKIHEDKYWNWIVIFGENEPGSHINMFRKLVNRHTRRTEPRNGRMQKST
jgi:A nuclease family of the HNH/ENDO VII superfamily with conserved AHH